jgi:hypothetical protein
MIDTKYAAWVGTEDEDGWAVNEEDILFTDSLDEARLWKTGTDAPHIEPGQTLGISDEDGVLSTITNTGSSYEVWLREE